MAISASSKTQDGGQRLPLFRLAWLVPLAVTVATLANAGFHYFVTRWLGEPLLFPSQELPGQLTPMPVFDVVLFSVVFGSAAGLVYALTTRLARRPVRTYVIISTVVLLLSCVPIILAPSPLVTLSARLTLITMHVIGAVAVVGTLVGLGPRRFGAA